MMFRKVCQLKKFSWSQFLLGNIASLIHFHYSRVPNKRGGGENNRGGGLEMVRYNNNGGVGIIGGGGAWRNRK